MAMTLDVNGKVINVNSPPDTPLLWVLRDELGLTGTKYGCGVAQCGACTVLVNGTVTRSCVTRLSTVPEGASVRTLDGLGVEDEPHALQRAFIDKQAGQCAFCVNGMIMGSLGWLESRVAAGNTAVPSREEIADYLSGALPESTFNYICRCGAHTRIIEAIHSGAVEMMK